MIRTEHSLRERYSVLRPKGTPQIAPAVPTTHNTMGHDAGSYLRLTDYCITQLKAQGPFRTCSEIH